MVFKLQLLSNRSPSIGTTCRDEEHMNAARFARLSVGWSAGILGVAGVSYAIYAATAWYRFGRPSSPSPDEVDSVMDRFMPTYDVAERHRVRVAAPVDLTYA